MGSLYDDPATCTQGMFFPSLLWHTKGWMPTPSLFVTPLRVPVHVHVRSQDLARALLACGHVSQNGSSAF